MTNIPALSHSRVITALTQQGLRFTVLPGGSTCVVDFACEETSGIRFDISVEGEDADILAVQTITGVACQPDDGPAVLGAINAWHCTNRWPTLALRIADGADPCSSVAQAVVTAEHHRYVPTGISDEDLNTILTLCFSAGVAALQAVAPRTSQAPQGTPSAEELNGWLDAGGDR